MGFGVEANAREDLPFPNIGRFRPSEPSQAPTHHDFKFLAVANKLSMPAVFGFERPGDFGLGHGSCISSPSFDV